MSVDLATHRFRTFDPTMGVPVRITVGAPRFKLGYALTEQVLELAPSGLMKLDGDAFVHAYRQRLDRLDLGALVEKFEAISARHDGDRLVLLCFEDVELGELCHRRVFAEWFEGRTAQQVPEIPATTTHGQSGQLTLDLPAPEGAEGTHR